MVAGGTAAAVWAYPKPFRDALSALTEPKAPERAERSRRFPSRRRCRPTASSRWAKKRRSGWDLETATVVPQTEPIRLELLGTTEYDSDNQTRIRPLFKGRVDRVYAKVGQLVKKGNRSSSTTAPIWPRPRTACEIERIQWVFCNNLLKVRESLAKTNAISTAVVTSRRRMKR